MVGQTSTGLLGDTRCLGAAVTRLVLASIVWVGGCAEGLDLQEDPKPTSMLGDTSAAGSPAVDDDDDDSEGDASAGDDTGGDTGGGDNDDPSDEGGSDDGLPDAPDPALCGDGFIDPGEGCDEGEANSPAGQCTPACQLPACGDGFHHAATEACDDGNATDTDACTNACAVAICGDGIVYAAVELCDDGNDSDTDGCTNTCTLASCGDGVVQAPEACDDGNDSDTDGCLSTCLNASCGDGFVHGGVEQCDDANGSDNDACPSTCQTATCGDGFVFAGNEACDDGNDSDHDACLGNCVAAGCGDGLVYEGVEDCDGGGDPMVYSCSPSCQDQLVWYQWSFGQNQQPNPMACADFTTWRSALADDHTSIHVAGTFDETGRTCTGAAATTLCNALRTGTDTTVNCGGHTWHVGSDCVGTMEVTVDGSVCDCQSPGYALRPCVDLPDWGGVATSTCSAVSQEIYIECGFD